MPGPYGPPERMDSFTPLGAVHPEMFAQLFNGATEKVGVGTVLLYACDDCGNVVVATRRVAHRASCTDFLNNVEAVLNKLEEIKPKE